MKYLCSDENLFYKNAEMHFHLQLLQRGQSEFHYFILSYHVYVLVEFFHLFFSLLAVPKFSHGRTPKIVFHILRSPHLQKHSLVGRSCRRGVQFNYCYIIAGCQYFQLLDRNSCDILRDIWNFSWHFKIHAF